MENINLKPNSPQAKRNIIKIVVILLFMAFSMTFLCGFLSSVNTYEYFINSINAKTSRVMKLVAASTSASALITMIPDDVGTPIAEQLAQLSKYFIIVLGAIYLEKYSLTIIGFVVSFILLPAAGCFRIAYLCRKNELFKKMAVCLLIISVLVASIVPASIFISIKIEETYHDSIEEAISLAVDTETAIDEAEKKEKSSIWETISNAAKSVVNTAGDAVQWAKTVLNHFIEAVTIILVTDCAIPLIVCIVFFIIIKRSIKIVDYIANKNILSTVVKMLDKE